MPRWWNLLNPFWRVEHRLAPYPLPFAPSPLDTRAWNVEIEPATTTLSVALPIGGTLSVGLHRILIEAGIAQTLATTSWDPRSWFSLYRYGSDFAGTAPRLRFYTGVQQKDPRLTAVASEEVATGITSYLLREHFGLDHVADVYACIDRGELNFVNPLNGKRPDYFCEDSIGETVLAESKGSTGTRSTITHRIDPEGWEQVQNVKPVNRPLRNSCSRVVIGTHFCVDGIHQKSETTTIIKDPSGPNSLNLNPDSDELIRLSYAKALRFMAQDAIAERLLVREPILQGFPKEIMNRLMNEIPAVRNIPMWPLGLTPFGDLIGLYGPVARVLLQQSRSSLRPAVVESLLKFRDTRSELAGVGYALPNGVMIVHNIDDLK